MRCWSGQQRILGEICNVQSTSYLYSMARLRIFAYWRSERYSDRLKLTKHFSLGVLKRNCRALINHDALVCKVAMPYGPSDVLFPGKL